MSISAMKYYFNYCKITEKYTLNTLKSRHFPFYLIQVIAKTFKVRSFSDRTGINNNMCNISIVIFIYNSLYIFFTYSV